EERYGDDAYTSDYRVYLTIDSRMQQAANNALRRTLLDYDVRHGFRGPEFSVELPADEEGMRSALADLPRTGDLEPAVVTAVGEQSVTAFTTTHGTVEIGWDGLEWARRYISEDRRGAAPKLASDIVAPGDVIRVLPADGGGWRLSQIPDVEGALVALDANDGAMLALAGGFDFFRSKFNRVLQAERQPGSNFKPFVYAAALDRGFTPASIINDAPVVFEDAGAEDMWRPENYSGKFFGPTRLREALTKSRNLVSIRLLNAIGVDYTVDYVQRFGFDPARLPRNLTLALGSATVKPIELVRGYAVLANGGFLIDPFIIDHVMEGEDKLVYRTRAKVACDACINAEQAAAMGLDAPVSTETASTAAQTQAPAGPRLLPEGSEPAPRVISEQTAWLMTSILRDVVKLGTARRALVLERKDLAGKTGTTNDQKDAWFSGYNAEIVATAWVGFDQLRELGRRETGSAAALPMWIDFMREALADRPEQVREQPSGLVTVRIDPETGALAAAGDPEAIFETFPADAVP
ncbi:MAG: peptidase, partial [Planctomycetes bacterium]|nr:peptidase [Planctomycetota bacterium]